MFHMDKSGSWSLGVLIGLPGVVVLVAALVAGGFWWLRVYHRADFEPGIFKVLAIGFWVLSAAAVVLSAAGYYPFSGEWQYTGTDGYDCRFVSTEAAA